MKKLYKINVPNLNFASEVIEYNNPKYTYLLTDKVLPLKTKVYKNTFYQNNLITISGEVCKTSNNITVIKNDFLENQKKIKIPKIKSKDDLLNTLKLLHYDFIYNNILNKMDSENIVLNAIDREDYILNEFMRLAINTLELLDTLDYLKNIFKLKNIYIVTKNTNYKSISNVKSIIGTYPFIKLVLVPDKYLIDKPYFLSKYLNIEESNTLFLSSEEVYTIYNLNKGKILDKKIITISGNALEKSVVVNTKIGVSINELVKELCSFNTDDYIVYKNGFLGFHKCNLNSLLVGDTFGVVINKNEHTKEGTCINCGACIKVCPYDIDNRDCVTCGLCSYICPENIINTKWRKYEKN